MNLLQFPVGGFADRSTIAGHSTIVGFCPTRIVARSAGDRFALRGSDRMKFWLRFAVSMLKLFNEKENLPTFEQCIDLIDLPTFEQCIDLVVQSESSLQMIYIARDTRHLRT